MKDEDIDYSDLPELDDSFFDRPVEIVRPKEQITLRVDGKVLDWYKQQHGRYQTLMHAVLCSYMKHQREYHSKPKQLLKQYAQENDNA